MSLYVLIAVLHLSPTLAGTLFMLASFWSAMTDIGLSQYLVEMKRHRLIASLTAICIAAGSFAGLPLLPEHSPFFALVALLVFRTAFSLFDAPHNGATAHVAALHGHIAVARWRSTIGAASAIIVGVIAMPLVDHGRQSISAAWWLLGGVAFAAVSLMLPLPWLLSRATQHATLTKETAAPRPVLDSIPGRRLLIFFLVQAAAVVSFATVGKSLLHLSTYGTSSSLLILSAMRLLAPNLWSPLAHRLTALGALTVSFAICALASILLGTFITLDRFSALAGLCIYGLCTGGTVFLIWASFSYLLEDATLQSRLTPSRGYGWSVSAQKIAHGISGLLAGIWVSGLNDGGERVSTLVLGDGSAAFCIVATGVSWHLSATTNAKSAVC